MNLNVFEGKRNPGVLFQPRIEPWFDLHSRKGDISGRFRGMSVRDFYDDLGVSMRYMHYYTGMPYPVDCAQSAKVRVTWQDDGKEGATVIETPEGRLVSKHQMTQDNTWRTVEFAAKTPRDLAVLRSYFENTAYHFNAGNFRRGSEFIGDRGEPQFWVPRSPYQALCLDWMSLEDFMSALSEEPQAVEDAMKAIDGSYDPLYEEITSAGCVRILNFGENIDINWLSPAYFEKYHMPFYAKRCGQLSRAHIRTHAHIDGSFKPLLKHLKRLPFDGLEALTPLPQGDVELEEIKEHIGDKVLLDGIPAVLFLPHFSAEAVQEFTERVIRLFHPRLVLGISDEFPQGAPEECLERVRWVANRCRRKEG